MTARRGRPINVAASVQQRLKNLAEEQHADFQLVLHRYGAERFLYRLGASTEHNRFVLKGAMLFRLWTAQEFRSTRDVDVLAHGATDPDSVVASVAAICSVDCPEDGVRFDPASIRVAPIRQNQGYGGVRVRLKGRLGSSRLDLQVDVGAGDAVTPAPVVESYPTLLDHPAPVLQTYPRETFISEKLEAMVRLGRANTRIKDFWDVAAMAMAFDFEGSLLTDAARATFERRQTEIGDKPPPALSRGFYEDDTRRRMWNRYRDQVHPAGPAPESFKETGRVIRHFLVPIFQAVVGGAEIAGRWQPPQGWGSAAESSR